MFTAIFTEAVTAAPGVTGKAAEYCTNFPLLAEMLWGLEQVVGLMQNVTTPSPESALMVAESVSVV